MAVVDRIDRDGLAAPTSDLKEINQALWDIEDEIRAARRASVAGLRNPVIDAITRNRSILG